MQAQKTGVFAQAGPGKFNNQGAQRVSRVFEDCRLVHEGRCDYVFIFGQGDVRETVVFIVLDDRVVPVREDNWQRINELLINAQRDSRVEAAKFQMSVNHAHNRDLIYDNSSHHESEGRNVRFNRCSGTV